MAVAEFGGQAQPAADQPVVRGVTVIMGTVVGLTFLFGFGNVLDLAFRLGVPIWVAPLVAPAVDLSILGLLLGTRHLALHGATPEQLRPARRLLIFASTATLALNIANPLVTAAYGKAAFDAVGPLLLIGWAEVGPGLLQAIATIGSPATTVFESGTRRISDDRHAPDGCADGVASSDDDTGSAPTAVPTSATADDNVTEASTAETSTDSDLLDCARQADARHWVDHRRPISADTLRRNLHISAARARLMVSIIRSERTDGQDADVRAFPQSELVGQSVER
jgi:hypothetical protein